MKSYLRGAHGRGWFEMAEQSMTKPVRRFYSVFALLLVLVLCVTSAPAQSARGSLTVTAQIVPSTTLIIGEDGKTRIVEANGPNGLTITILDAPATPGVTANGPSTSTTLQQASERSGKSSK
jgi:hypothetical protein